MKTYSLIDSLKTSRCLSFIIIAVIYLLAAVIGILTFAVIEDRPVLVRLFAADFTATVFVWLWGVIFRNSSVYDPYWSVAPPLMLTGYAWFCGASSLPVMLLLAAVWYWAIRLTGNWAYTFPNLNRQDWRYDMYKAKFPRLWHLVNFTGINLMPTVIVFLAMVPGFLLIELSSSATFHANAFTWIGFMVCIGAATLQLISDTQAHRFRKDRRGQVCTIGLWSLSRHPNYLGEIMMWWGVYMMYLTVGSACGAWKVILLPAAGALANTCLFVFISIPMMEKRQLANKPGYAEYRKNVRMLI